MGMERAEQWGWRMVSSSETRPSISSQLGDSFLLYCHQDH